MYRITIDLPYLTDENFERGVEELLTRLRARGEIPGWLHSTTARILIERPPGNEVYHHPGTDKRGHPIGECRDRGCQCTS